MPGRGVGGLGRRCSEPAHLLDDASAAVPPRAATATEDHAPHAPLLVLLAASWAVVVAATLSASGQGWAWGDPSAEVAWYASGSRAAVLQLVGNLLLLVPSTLLGVRVSRHAVPVVVASAAAGPLIELLQLALPLGRVVSPVDAALNASGAAVAGLLVVLGRRPSPAPRPATARTPA